MQDNYFVNSESAMEVRCIYVWTMSILQIEHPLTQYCDFIKSLQFRVLVAKYLYI